MDILRNFLDSETTMRRPGIALMSLVLLVAGPATAADLSVMRTTAPVMAAVPNYDWSGVYLGGHLGYGWGDNNVTIVTGSPSFPVGFMQPNNGATGFIGGGQLGLNRQIGVWVLGIEGDFTGADMAGTARSISPTIAGVFSDNTSHVNWTSTVAGRLGYAWGSWLLYGKGGVAFADFTGHATTFNPNGSVRATTSGTETRTGWIAG
jgi:outer membrane immunogenic protein